MCDDVRVATCAAATRRVVVGVCAVADVVGDGAERTANSNFGSEGDLVGRSARW